MPRHFVKVHAAQTIPEKQDFNTEFTEHTAVHGSS